MLRKILTSFGFPQYKTTENYTLPWGMTQADYTAMQRLMKSEDFEAWKKTLDNVVNSYAESMLATNDSDTLHFLRGKIVGVRYSLEIVDEIFKQEQDFLINERRRAESGNDPSRRVRSTFGTPSWGASEGTRN